MKRMLPELNTPSARSSNTCERELFERIADYFDQSETSRNFPQIKIQSIPMKL